MAFGVDLTYLSFNVQAFKSKIIYKESKEKKITPYFLVIASENAYINFKIRNIGKSLIYYNR